ncbi:MAG: hypothetical protein JJU37_15525 [Balneolaceae bacterium]|nr:hypothetical protein [Balneolaceae bacterium]
MIRRWYMPVLLILPFLIVACDNYEPGIFTEDERIVADFPPNTEGLSPSDLFNGLVVLFDDLENLSAEEIENLDSDQLWELSEPLLKLWKNTIDLPDITLNALREPLGELYERSRSWELTRENHAELSREIKLAITSNRFLIRQEMEQRLDEVRSLLQNWVQNESKEAVCSELFNRTGDAVVLMPGDNFEAAGFFCPENTLFYIYEGIHSGQSVTSPKEGMHWIGAGSESTIMDGNNTEEHAFLGRMIYNSYHFFQIRNYVWFGINSIDRQGNSYVEISNMAFSLIGDGWNGEEYGAVKTEWMTHFLLRDSSFENVTSAVRLVNSVGPLRVINNEALNPGRNFFQCDKCFGGGIQINRNSLQHTEKFGTDVLEDYISIFQSEGEEDDWIQVNYNRARGHGGSLSGSFMILADAGGKYQEAIGNVGVNPGQVGIGVASGEFIRVEGNIMYSESWSGSNVAYYSADFDPPCNNHIFPGPGSGAANLANWTSAAGQSNRAWSNGNCGITNLALRDSIIDSPSIGPEIWDSLP